ncbi:MAG: tRNA-dihydrouridine synthase [Gemmataceae bacterium]
MSALLTPPIVPPRPQFAGPVFLGSRAMPSRYFLAPLAGYTNLALRRTLREVGGLGLATSDLVNARSLLEGSRKSKELIALHSDDRPTAIQIYGPDADYLTRGAQHLVALGVEHIDINMGCPVNKVTKTGGGSAMMCDTTGKTIDLVRRVVEGVPVPVTVKMRLGWDAVQLTAPFFAREFEQVGVAGITIHGRTRAQGFSGSVDLDGIARVVEAVERIPVVGNGDVRTLADAARMFAVTGCRAIAIGRGALLNPWFFKQLCQWESTGHPGEPPTYHERLNYMETHVRRLCDLRGERFGCLQFRKVANWYCKVLKPGKNVQQVLVMLDTLATFDEIVGQLREQGPPPGWQAGAAPAIPVPKGPIDKW